MVKAPAAVLDCMKPKVVIRAKIGKNTPQNPPKPVAVVIIINTPTTRVTRLATLNILSKL